MVPAILGIMLLQNPFGLSYTNWPAQHLFHYDEINLLHFFHILHTYVRLKRSSYEKMVEVSAHCSSIQTVTNITSLLVAFHSVLQPFL